MVQWVVGSTPPGYIYITGVGSGGGGGGRPYKECPWAVVPRLHESGHFQGSYGQPKETFLFST